jgi:hypothetical protein
MNALVGALNPRRLKRSPLKVSEARVVQGWLGKAETHSETGEGP